MGRIADTFHLPEKQDLAQADPAAPRRRGQPAGAVPLGAIPPGIVIPMAYTSAELLIQSFDWSQTAEGYHHWQVIYHRLMDIAGGGKL